MRPLVSARSCAEAAGPPETCADTTSSGPAKPATAAPAVAPKNLRRDNRCLFLFFCGKVSISFVRKALYGFYAVAECLEKCLTPPARCVWNSSLIGLLVGLGVEPHGQMIWCRVLLHRNSK